MKIFGRFDGQRWLLALCLCMGIAAARAADGGAKPKDLKKALPEMMEAIRDAAKKGDLEAQLSLASAYMKGTGGVTQDYALAIHWYRKAAEQDSPVARFNLGLCYDEGLGVEPDIQRALEYYRAAADANLLPAQLNAAITLMQLQRPDEAVPYFKLAADGGNTVARREYGRCLLLGKGVEQAPRAAVEVLLQAADANDTEALILLADAYNGQYPPLQRDARRVFDYLWQAAALDSPEALSKVGFCYESGIGVVKDTETAVRWYRKAAELGHAPAMVNLAHCYLRGRGLPMDPEQAAQWYRRGAEAGYPMAGYNLGVCYALGQGVEPDDREARNWFRKAAEGGVVNAFYNLGLYCEEGRGGDKDPVAAVKWYRLAAERDDPAAMLALGKCYLNGVGVEQDRAAARSWIAKAASEGSEEARAILENQFR